MSVDKFVILILCTYAAAELYEGDSCTTKNNAVGECRQLPDCPSATKKKLNRIRYDFIRCGFIDRMEVLCCPELSTTLPPITENDDINADFYFQPDKIRPTLPPTVNNIPSRIYVRKCIRACTEYINNSPESVTPHILEGEEVKQGDFPHMVALGYMKENTLSYDCGGTLISNRFVLTAAHCVLNQDRIKPHVARIGSVDLNDEELGINYYVESDIVHPQYNRSRSYYDIALLKLNRTVEFIGDVHPACINAEPTNPTEGVIITGWGTTDITRVSKSRFLLRANLSAVANEVCNQTYTKKNDKRKLEFGITPNQMCAMDLRGKIKIADTCQGDSGGPLQVKREGTVSFYTVYGVTSFGRTCGTANPAVYTRVSSYLDWIEENVWPNEFQD